MKKSLFFLFALICSMSLFTACSDDDDPDYSKVIEEEIAGDYKGTLDVSVDGNKLQGGISKKVTVEKAGPTAINLSLKDFTLIIPVGDVMLHNCQLKEEQNGYSFVGTDKLAVNGLDCTIGVQGTVQGKQLKVNLDVDAKLGAVKQQVTVTFNGEKLNGGEKTEAKITSFSIDSKMITEAPEINEAAGTITFKVNKDAENLMFAPVIVVSEGATVTPASGVEQDFSGDVTYTVVSEDYGTVKTYVAKIAGKQVVMKYDFEEWKTIENSEDPKNNYELPAAAGWSGADAALSLIRLFDIEVDNSLMATEEAYSGAKAAKIVTLDSKGMASLLPGVFPAIPKVTSGSLFLGSFEVDATNTLRSTRFGIEYSNKPLVVKGYYKYTPGAEYYVCADPVKSEVAVLDETKSDECALSAVLYEVSSYDTPSDPQDLSDERLNGTNIYTSERVVASAVLESGKTEGYIPFELKLNYVKDFDSSKLYRFAIICSSSKEGIGFSGAPGSTLLIDDIEVINE